MLESRTIQSTIGITYSHDDYYRQFYGIIPDSQCESRFPDHIQWVHLSTICDIIVRDSVRKHWLYNAKALFYLYENYGSYFYYEELRLTDWAREALLNRTCTKSCTNCLELSKGRGRAKIECRLRDY